ncbi:MAG: MFS transporter [Actinomycetota bacterium]
MARADVDMTDDLTALPQTSVFQQLRATPRIFAFMGLLIGSAMSLGAREVARWQYLDEAFSDEWGLGETAAVAAVTVAVTSLTLGRVMDRRDPRPFVLVAFALAILPNGLIGFLLLQGPLPIWIALVAAAFDGAGLGLAGVSLLKTQAAFVNPGAEGAAEILNVLRLGIGGVLGALLAGLSPDPAWTLLATVPLLAVSSFLVWIVMRPITPRTPPAGLARIGLSVVAYLRATPRLARIVGVDLTLSLVIPTQLVNLVLTNLDAPNIAAASIASGMVGVLLGRLALTLIGFRGNPRLILLITVGSLSCLQFLGAVSLTDRWILSQPLALPAIVILGTIASTYAQGLLAAIIQQEVAEEYRGRLGSILVAGRNILISVGALAGALSAVTLGAQWLLGLLACSLLVVIGVTRGFSVLSSKKVAGPPLAL